MYLNKNCKKSGILGIGFGLLLYTISFSLLSAEKSHPLLADDILNISVWKEADLQREVLVRPDGKISFPLAGHVVAAGRTPEEVEQAITVKLSRFIPDPVVTVAVSKLAGYKIYVLGKVAKPGQYVVSQMNVMQALSLAGGLTRFASESKIKILRQVDEKQTAISFNYGQVAGGEDLNQNVILRPGDVLVVR